MKRLCALLVFASCYLTLQAQTNIDSTSRQLPEFTIAGNFPVYIQALVQQRQADGIMNLLNLDLPGRFPDLNPAEALQRLPGVVLERSQGEGRFVHIRGADPTFTTVMLDGEQIITPEANHRFLQFDLVPADQLRAVEVWKTNRPDQDGDAIGGAINLLTRNPGSGKSVWQSTLAGGYNPKAGQPNGQAQVSYSGKNLLLNASLWQDQRATDNLETLYEIRGNGTQKELFISDLELRHLEIARRRLGLSGTYLFPFKNDRGQAYLRGMLLDFQEKNLRQRLRYRPGKGSSNPLSDTIFDAAIGRDVQYIKETERFSSLQAGFERKMLRWKLDGAAAYSYGLESEPEGRQFDFKLTGVDLKSIGTDPKFPQFIGLNGEAQNAYDQFVLNELEAENDHSNDQSFTLRGNAQLNLNKPNNYLKFGAKARTRHKNSQASESIFDGYNGTVPFAMSDFLMQGNHSFLGKNYDFGQQLDWNLAEKAIAANKDNFQLNQPETTQESTAGNFDILENASALYALIHLEHENWQWLAGARMEHTYYRYTADQVSIDSLGGITRRKDGRVFKGDFTFLLPTIQAKYKASNTLIFQAALSTAYSRPSFDQLAPYELFNQLDGTVLAGNPKLKPAYSWNLDLALEKQISGNGAVSFGLFGKQISNFIFTQQSRDSRLWGGSQVNVLTTVPLNGEIAWLAGVEMGWQQRLTFLPGAWSGLGVYANYTYTWSRAFAAEEGAASTAEEEGFRLPGQAAHSGNFALWYDRKKWSGRIALNLQSDFLLQAAEPEDAESQLIYGGSAQLDLNLGYALGKHATLFAEGLNLLNTPLQYFTGNRSHPSKLEYYGAWGRFGIKFAW